MKSLSEHKLLGDVVLASKLEAQWSASLGSAVAAEQDACIARVPGVDRSV
jgi:hypothetical protein